MAIFSGTFGRKEAIFTNRVDSRPGRTRFSGTSKCRTAGGAAAVAEVIASIAHKGAASMSRELLMSRFWENNCGCQLNCHTLLAPRLEIRRKRTLDGRLTDLAYLV